MSTKTKDESVSDMQACLDYTRHKARLLKLNKFSSDRAASSSLLFALFELGPCPIIHGSGSRLLYAAKIRRTTHPIFMLPTRHQDGEKLLDRSNRICCWLEWSHGRTLRALLVVSRQSTQQQIRQPQETQSRTGQHVWLDGPQGQHI